MIPIYHYEHPRPTDAQPAEEAARPLTAEAEEARERQQAVRTESMVQTAAEAILAEAMSARTPVAALHFRVLRSKNASPPQQDDERGVSGGGAEGKGGGRARRDLSDEQRAALDRAHELRATRMKIETAEEEAAAHVEEEEEQQTGAAKADATELEIRKATEELLANAMATETPVAMAKAAGWRRATQSALRARDFTPKEEAALGGRRTGDRTTIEVAPGPSDDSVRH